MELFIQRGGLRDIYDKVVAGERISEADALRLFESKDLNAVGAIADFANRRKNGNRASYIINRYVNYSNYCILSCQFCSFARKKRDADGFQFTIEEIVQKAREALKLGITELHIVGGLHPSLPFSYYTDMLKALRALNDEMGSARASRAGSGTSPEASSNSNSKEDFRRGAENDTRGACATRLQLKCFTAIEILHLAWLAKKSVEQTLIELKDAGLDSLTGGGAEIFRKEVRSPSPRARNPPRNIWTFTAPGTGSADAAPARCFTATSKASPTAWIICGNCARCRTRRTASVGFVPLAYQPQDNDIPVDNPPTGFDSLRTIAVSRIYLDNFQHITAYWVGLGLKLAQVALSYGADDLHGTIIEEHIFHMAGATSPQLQTEAAMLKAIREAGRTPVQRNTFYEPIKVLADRPQTEPISVD